MSVLDSIQRRMNTRRGQPAPAGVSAVRRAIAEPLEARRVLASLGTLLQYDFNATAAWPATPGPTTVGVTATQSSALSGTIDVEHGVDRSRAMTLAIAATPGGYWKSTLGSGTLAFANGEAMLGKLTLSFDLNASQALPVKVIVESYNGSVRTGGLEASVLPAAAGSYQHYAVDLSTMSPAPGGAFVPTATSIAFGFQLSSQAGWAGPTMDLSVDNVNFAKPAYYVKPAGSNNNSGRTEALAFATAQKALDVCQPGDIILMMGGTYNIAYTGAGRINVSKGGSPAAWVTLKNYPGQTPLINNEWWNAINIGASSASTAPAIAYVEVRGLHIKGGSAKVGSRAAPDGNYDPTAPNADQYGPYAQYLQPVDPATGMTPAGPPDPRTNGNGIGVSGRYEANKPHDLRFADLFVEQNAGGGIGAGDADRVQIENNVVRDNCYWDKYATSGISILSTYSFDGTSSTVTRLVRNNLSSGNIHKQKWVRNSPTLTQYSDGNGIIIDINNDPTNVALGRTLVANNVTFDNGGSGIHAYRANHVDIVNNVAYLNSASPYLTYGQIFANDCSDVQISNNVLVARVAPAGQAAEPVNGGATPSLTNKIVYRNNIYSGGNTAAFGANAYNVANVVANPLFALASVDPLVADFRLSPGSPAINAGTTLLAPALDLIGNVRNGAPDSGAYEYYASTPTIVAAAASPAPVTGTTATLTAAAGDDAGPNLTYTWSVNAKPAGAADPGFSDNATLTAKTVLATFTKAGTYVLNLRVADADAHVAGSTLTVIVSQTLRGLNVTTAGNVVAPGSSVAFAVAGVDQFGDPTAAPVVAWSSTRGAIASDGKLTAPAGAGGLIVTAAAGSFSASAAVSVALVATTPVFDISASPHKLRIGFNGDVSASLTAGDFVVTNIATAAALPANSFSLAYTVATNSVTLAYASGVLPDGRYRLTIAANAVALAGGQPLAAPVSFDFHFLLGDLNDDQQIGFADLLALTQQYGGPGTYLGGDFNYDGVINFDDLLLLAQRYGTSLAVATPSLVVRKPVTAAGKPR